MLRKKQNLYLWNQIFNPWNKLNKKCPWKKSAGKKSQKIEKLHSWNIKSAPDRNRHNDQKRVSRVLFIFTKKKLKIICPKFPNRNFNIGKVKWNFTRNFMKFRAIFHKISIEISIKISIEISLPYPTRHPSNKGRGRHMLKTPYGVSQNTAHMKWYERLSPKGEFPQPNLPSGSHTF